MSDAIFYVGSNNTFTAEIRTKAGVVRDLDALGVNRCVLQLAGSTIDSSVYPDAIDYTTGGSDGLIEFDLTGFEFAAGSYGARIIIYYTQAPQGEVVADGLSVKIESAIAGIAPDTDTTQTILDMLASNENGLGASLVGIEDAAGDFTATEVEAALAELHDTKVDDTGDTMVGDLNYNNGTIDTPGTVFYDPINNTRSTIDQFSEVFRVFTQYRGGSILTPLGIILSSGELQNLGNRVLTVADAPLEVDGTAGRVLRTSVLNLVDGTDANTVYAELVNHFNGDSQAGTNNIAETETDGIFTLASGGLAFNINPTGDAVSIMSIVFEKNTTGTTYFILPTISSGSISLSITTGGTTALDFRTVLDAGVITLRITYMTDA